jgi:CubicO group peptidase (beta-lactamase class C family)
MLRSRRWFLLISTLVASAACAATGLVSAATAAADEPTDYHAVISKLSGEIPEEMKAAKAVGLSIALVDRDRTVWTKGFGLANRERGVPATADTLFHIGSSAKTMTAVAVMQLVEQGLVDLDRPLAQYVPGFSIKPRFKNSVITVRSALDMHSGIPGEILNGMFTKGGPFPGFQNRLLRVLAQEYPQRPVNTAWAYSNSGYILLQMLVENVSGQDFDTYTREHLFGPAGMASTSFDDVSIPAGSNLARPYLSVPGGNGVLRARRQPREYVNAGGAGAAISSATDMAAYLKVLVAGGAAPGGRLLEASSINEMITPQTDAPLDIMPWRPGLGWWVNDTSNAWMGKSAYWGGDSLFHHTFLRWLPELGVGVFVTVNTTTAQSVRDDVGLRALGLIVTAKTGRTSPAPPRIQPVVRASARKLRRAAGRYASTAGLDLVEVSGRALRWTPGSQTPGAASARMLPRADGWYTPRAGDPSAPVPVSIKPATVAGHRLLLIRTGPSFVIADSEKIPSRYRVSKAWRARTGGYRPITTVPDTYPGTDVSKGRLWIYRGVLIWSTKSSGGVFGETSRVLVPAGSRRAFTFGNPRYAGDVVTPAGRNLSILGLKFRRIGG